MKLTDAKGTSLSQTVSGYEFPAMADDQHDSNWLNIAGRIQRPYCAWTFDEPCLLTHELERICDWLDAVAVAPGTEHIHEWFLEPNLEFEVVPRPNKMCLRVRLCCEAIPAWLAEYEDRYGGVCLEFPIQDNDLCAVARDLREELSRFPQRAEMKRRPRAPACPSCGAKDVVPIEYGLPDFDLFEAEARGEVELGGCVVGDDDPKWKCRACETAFGHAPESG